MKNTFEELISAWPAWWHCKGNAVSIKFDPHDKHCLTFTSGSCHVKITALGDRRERWHVRWIIFHKVTNSAKRRIEGEMVLKTIELQTAFNLPHADGRYATDPDFAAHYNASYGLPGIYIRKISYLNIPCPGTGLDGDPNASIYIFEELQKRLAKFIATGVANP